MWIAMDVLSEYYSGGSRGGSRGSKDPPLAPIEL